MDEYTEKRFGYLRELSRDEKLRKIEELEEDIIRSQEIINDKTTSGDQRTEMYNDIGYDREVIEYLNYLLNEKNL